MLDANDIQVLREMFVEQDVRLVTKMTEFHGELRKELHRELHKVRNDIIDVINGVLPQIDGLDRRVSRLERWARLA
jgi:hypothetical protein